MKKLIYLLLVVGTASVANASMVLELRHGAGDTVDIYATSAYTIIGDDIYFTVVGDTSVVTISGGTVGVLEPMGPVPRDTMVYDPTGIPEPPPDPLDGIWGFIGVLGMSTDADVGTYIHDINWSLVGGATSAEIFLFSTLDFLNFSLLDTIEVPEPMTIALVGLGGLFLLRRRR